MKAQWSLPLAFSIYEMLLLMDPYFLFSIPILKKKLRVSIVLRDLFSGWEGRGSSTPLQI